MTPKTHREPRPRAAVHPTTAIFVAGGQGCGGDVPIAAEQPPTPCPFSPDFRCVAVIQESIGVQMASPRARRSPGRRWCGRRRRIWLTDTHAHVGAVGPFQVTIHVQQGNDPNDAVSGRESKAAGDHLHFLIHEPSTVAVISPASPLLSKYPTQFVVMSYKSFTRWRAPPVPGRTGVRWGPPGGPGSVVTIFPSPSDRAACPWGSYFQTMRRRGGCRHRQYRPDAMTLSYTALASGVPHAGGHGWGRSPPNACHVSRRTSRGVVGVVESMVSPLGAVIRVSPVFDVVCDAPASRLTDPRPQQRPDPPRAKRRRARRRCRRRRRRRGQ